MIEDDNYFPHSVLQFLIWKRSSKAGPRIYSGPRDFNSVTWTTCFSGSSFPIAYSAARGARQARRVLHLDSFLLLPFAPFVSYSFLLLSFAPFFSYSFLLAPFGLSSLYGSEQGAFWREVATEVGYVPAPGGLPWLGAYRE